MWGLSRLYASQVRPGFGIATLDVPAAIEVCVAWGVRREAAAKWLPHIAAGLADATAEQAAERAEK